MRAARTRAAAVAGRRGRWPRALTVIPEEGFEQHSVTLLLSSTVVALPLGLPDAVVNNPQAIEAALNDYPTLGGGSVQVIDTDHGPRVLHQYVPAVGHGPRVARAAEDHTVTSRATRMEEMAPTYRSASVRAAIPRVNEADALTPLTIWWVLLFALCHLARYEPATWVGALDVDRSPIAEHLGATLDEALLAVPHLTLCALLSRNVLVGAYD